MDKNKSPKILPNILWDSLNAYLRKRYSFNFSLTKSQNNRNNNTGKYKKTAEKEVKNISLGLALPMTILAH